MKYIVFVIYLLFASVQCYAQGIVQVDPLTGAAQIYLPFYTFTSGQVSVPIGLSYNSSGVRLKEVEGTAGIGWQFEGGGAISRSTKGLPDDVSKDLSGNARLGWMKSTNTAAEAIDDVSFQNDGVVCSKETSDITAITSNFPYNYDTEPDVFTISAPGLSGKIIYDRAVSKFRPLSYADWVITYTTEAVTGLMSSFTIITDNGVKYVFAAPESVRTTLSAGGTHTYFETKYKQYQYGIRYYDLWQLASITDANGNGVTLTYSDPTDEKPRRNLNPFSIYLPGATTPTLQYETQVMVTTPLLQSVGVTGRPDVRMDLDWELVFGSNILTRCKGIGRDIELSYSSVESSGSSYIRKFLRQVTDPGCSTPFNYKFEYSGETLTDGHYMTLLPDASSVQMDYWGYYTNAVISSLQPKIMINPATAAYPRYAIYNASTTGGSYSYTSTNGSDRSSATVNYTTGSLTKVIYPYGGTTTVLYEKNAYIDQPSGAEVTGGGLRVKRTTDYDNMDVAKNIVKNYSYDDPATGLSSGKPISLPQFAFTIPYAGAATGSALWNANTIYSDYDLSSEDHGIIYRYFKVSQTGAGSTLSEFFIPATYWATSASPVCSGCTTEWAPTINLIARNNCGSVYGPISNDRYNYPFNPNPNYDFERGLLKKKTAFNDAGQEVAEQNYIYQRSFSPSFIYAFRSENNPNGSLTARSYNKYKIYYNTSELVKSVNSVVYDSPTQSQATTSTTNYVYGGTNHKKVSEQSITNSDNDAVLTTKTKYTHDYSAASGSNDNVTAIYNLNQKNINLPVETIRTMTRSGGVKTIGADLTFYKGVTSGSSTNYVTSQLQEVVFPDGVDDFVPFSISGQVITKDSRYYIGQNNGDYDKTGHAQTINDGSKNSKVSIFDHAANQEVAVFLNADYNEIAFSDFDTDQPSLPDYNFIASGGGSFAASGSHTGKAYGFGTAQTFTKTAVRKNAQSASYIFSAWIKSAGSGHLTFTLTGGGTLTSTKSYGSGDWGYYEWKLPVTSITTTTFTLTVTTDAPISIDDMLFYPETSEVVVHAFDPVNFYEIATTNTNGLSSYSKRDKWGRTQFKYDQDKNITEKYSYVISEQLEEGLTAPTVWPVSIYVLTDNEFNASSSACLTGTTFSWDFGDGTVINDLQRSDQVHKYLTTGTFTIKVTATHPFFGTEMASTTVTVKPPVLVPQICLSGVSSFNTCANTAIEIETCGSNPSNSHTSYYTVNSVGGSGYGTLSYQWQMSLNNGASWTNVGTNSTQYSVSCDRSSYSYLTRCQVTSSSGQFGISNVAEFSTPNCE